MKHLKHVKLFDTFSINEGLFGNLFGDKNPQVSQPTDETANIKSKIGKVFPEQIYGRYLDNLSQEQLYKLYQVIDNNQTTMNDSALLDVLNGDESKREELMGEERNIFWLKCLIRLIETGHFFDTKGNKYDFSFFNGLTETSLKQIMSNIKSKTYLIGELIRLSREKSQPILTILSNKF
jgi:hypothetical protein